MAPSYALKYYCKTPLISDTTIQPGTGNQGEITEAETGNDDDDYHATFSLEKARGCDPHHDRVEILTRFVDSQVILADPGYSC